MVCDLRSRRRSAPRRPAALSRRGFPFVPSLLVGVALALDIGATLAFQLTVALGRTVWWSFRYPFRNLLLAAGALRLLLRARRRRRSTAPRSRSPLAPRSSSGSRIVATDPRGSPPGTVPSGVSRLFRLPGASTILQIVTHRGGVVLVALVAGSRVKRATRHSRSASRSRSSMSCSRSCVVALRGSPLSGRMRRTHRTMHQLAWISSPHRSPSRRRHVRPAAHAPGGR